MSIEFLKLSGVIMIFVGTYTMIASYETYHHANNDRLSTLFVWLSVIIYLIAAVLVSVRLP